MPLEASMGSGSSKTAKTKPAGSDGDRAPASAAPAAELPLESPVNAAHIDARAAAHDGPGDDGQRCVVYLGASAPVHATHTNLIQSLLDEGFDRVFIFILRWSPDRAGVTAEAGAAQLAKWLLSFQAEGNARTKPTSPPLCVHVLHCVHAYVQACSERECAPTKPRPHAATRLCA